MELNAISPETPPVVQSGQEPVPEPVQKPVQEPVEDPNVLTPEPVEPPAESVSAEEAVLHRLQSWQGRRDTELRNEIESRHQLLLEEIRQIRESSEAPPEAPDPLANADAWFDHKMTERTTQEKTFYSVVEQTAANLIRQDPIAVKDNAVAQEIAKEIVSGSVLIDRSLPPKVAAQLAVSKAKANVLERRFVAKTNPLAQNRPTNIPLGNVSPATTPTNTDTKLPKMSKLATTWAKRWGYTDEQTAEILKE